MQNLYSGDRGDGKERSHEQSGLGRGIQQINLQSVDSWIDGELESGRVEPGSEGKQHGAGKNERRAGLCEEINVIGRSLGERASEEHERAIRIEPNTQDLAGLRENSVEILVEFDFIRLDVEDSQRLIFD